MGASMMIPIIPASGSGAVATGVTADALLLLYVCYAGMWRFFPSVQKPLPRRHLLQYL